MVAEKNALNSPYTLCKVQTMVKRKSHGRKDHSFYGEFFSAGSDRNHGLFHLFRGRVQPTYVEVIII